MPSFQLSGEGFGKVNIPFCCGDAYGTEKVNPPLPCCDNPLFMMNRRIIDGEELSIFSPSLSHGRISQEDFLHCMKREGIVPAGQFHAEAMLENGVPEEWKMFILFFPGTIWTPASRFLEEIFIPIIACSGGKAEIGFHSSFQMVNGPESRIVATSDKVM